MPMPSDDEDNRDSPDDQPTNYDRPENNDGEFQRRHRRESEFDWSLVRSTTQPIAENWFIKYWRPSMAWLYMAVVAFDFILAPLMSMLIPVLPFVTKAVTYAAWHPITLEGGGLIHVTFGAVLGVTAWGRTKEKIDPVANDKSG